MKPDPGQRQDELLPLSALQHLLFCERQCALIHVEGLWLDNPLTVEGDALHERVDSGEVEVRGDLRVYRGLPLRSLRLGLVGKADAVELERAEAGGLLFPGLEGRWHCRPVEYKRGKPKPDPSDQVQLCAQALCLEEMVGGEIREGALFYGKTRRRTQVVLDQTLRTATEDACRRLRQLVERRETPRVARQPKCRRCSLEPVCRPDATGRSVRRYLDHVLREGES